MKASIIAILSFLLFASAPATKTEIGVWKTIDDETGKAKSHVKIYKKDGKLYGKIVKLYREKGEDPNPKCTKCPGDRKNKYMIGMEIIDGLKKKDGKWVKDDGILDPNNGKVYDCKIWLDDDDPNLLHVRGYIGILYRTQEWHRVK